MPPGFVTKQRGRSPSRTSEVCGQTWEFHFLRKRSTKISGTCGGTFPGNTPDVCGCGRYTHHCLVPVSRYPAIGKAAHALDSATAAGDRIYVPSICLVELTYLVEKGRLPIAARDRLIGALDD